MERQTVIVAVPPLDCARMNCHADPETDVRCRFGLLDQQPLTIGRRPDSLRNRCECDTHAVANGLEEVAAVRADCSPTCSSCHRCAARIASG